MLESGLGHTPRLRPRGEGRVLHFRGVIKSAEGAGDRDAAGIAWSPDDGIAQIFVGVIAVIVLADVPPIQELVGVFWRPVVPDTGEILVRQRRVDEGILPGVMPRNPVADYGGELPDLEVNTFAWAVAEKIFVQPQFRATVSWVEPAVHARLSKDIELRSNLSVEEQGESWIQEKVALGKDEGGSGLIDEIGLEIDESAQLQVKAAIRIAQGKRVMDLLRNVSARAAAECQGQRKNQRPPPGKTMRNGRARRHGEVSRSSRAGRRA